MTKPWDAAPQPYGSPTGWARPGPGLPATWDGHPVQIAEITVDGTWVITPLGTLDRRNARWSLGPQVPAHESAPGWAVAAAAILALFTCFLSLLLLLVKETDVWSSTLIVTDGQVTFSTTVYSRDTAQYEGIRAAISWARQLPGAASTGQIALPS